jgi:putative ABC transport system permease protein
VQQVGEHMNGRWGTGATAAGRNIDIDYEGIDENYIPALGIVLLQGRNFSKDFPSDSFQSVIVNQAFVKEAGWKDPIGKTVDFINGKEYRLTVIGVVKDYHFASLKQKIKPWFFLPVQKLNWAGSSSA